MVDRAAWPAPPISGLIQGAGGIADPEMFATLDMGIGVSALEASATAAVVIGAIKAGGGTPTVTV